MDIQPQTQARIVMLNGLGYTYDEIADRMNVSSSTVGETVRTWKERADESPQWREVYWRCVLADVFGSDFQRLLAESVGGSDATLSM